jgi:hypothetical protein
MVFDSSNGINRGESFKVRLIGSTILAVLIISAYWWMFYDSGYQSGQQERKANVESAHYSAFTAKHIGRECSTKSGDAARNCITGIVKAERESQRSESDLAAQWEAAEWSKWAGIAALAQIIATIIGLYFLKGTLDATLKAVEDTGKATEAMREANIIAKRVGEAAVQAHILIESLKGVFQPFEPNNWQLEIVAVIKNTGQTVADSLIFQMNITDCCGKAHGLGPFEPYDSIPHSLECSELTRLTFKDNISYPCTDIQMFEDKWHTTPYFFVEICYADVFGNARTHSKLYEGRMDPVVDPDSGETHAIDVRMHETQYKPIHD